MHCNRHVCFTVCLSLSYTYIKHCKTQCPEASERLILHHYQHPLSYSTGSSAKERAFWTCKTGNGAWWCAPNQPVLQLFFFRFEEPSIRGGTQTGFLLGPSVIDSSFQALMALADPDVGIGSLKIPLSIKRPIVRSTFSFSAGLARWCYRTCNW